MTAKTNPDCYKNGSVDLGNAEVDWAVDNFGKIEGGIFDYKDDLKDVLTNEEGGVIDGGTFKRKSPQLRHD